MQRASRVLLLVGALLVGACSRELKPKETRPGSKTAAPAPSAPAAPAPVSAQPTPAAAPAPSPERLAEARARFAKGDRNGATEECTRLIAADPNDAVAFAFRAWIRFQSNDWSGAIEDSTRAATLDPRSADAYFVRGSARWRKGGDLDGAAGDLTVAIGLNPGYKAAYLHRGLVHMYARDDAASVADLTKYLELEPNDPRGYADRAHARLSLGDADGALADSDRALALGLTDLWDLYEVRAFAHSWKLEYATAVGELTKAIEANPHNGLDYYYRGAARALSGDHPGALVDHERAIAMSPDLPYAYLGRAISRAAEGDRPGALADLETAAQKAAAQTYAVESSWFRSVLAAARGDFARAFEELQAFLMLKRTYACTRPSALWFRADLEHRKGDHAAAMRDEDEAIRLAPARGAHRPARSPFLLDLAGATPAPAAAPPAARPGDTYVLVVAIDRYQDEKLPPLAFAEADAREVYGFYATDDRSPTKPDRVVTLLGKEATQRHVLRAIREHLATKAIDPEDTAVFYFAGHGLASAQSTYLACFDTETDGLPESGISTEALRDALGEVRARKVVILDACHAAAVGRLRGIGGVTLAPAGSEKARATLFVTAAGADELSLEDPKLGHGIFTLALLKGLRGAADENGDGRVQGEELSRFLPREVGRLAALTGAKQTPIVQGGGAGFWLTR